MKLSLFFQILAYALWFLLWTVLVVFHVVESTEYQKRNLSFLSKDSIVYFDVHPPHAITKWKKLQFRGSFRRKMKRGDYWITVSAKGYTTKHSKISVLSNDFKEIRIELEPQPVRVLFTSQPSGSNIFINEKYRGKTPFSCLLKPQWYRILYKKIGYVQEGKDFQVQANLKNKFQLLLGGARKQRKKDLAWMRFVPKGYFQRGLSTSLEETILQECKKQKITCRKSWFQSAQPQKPVKLSSFWIDEFEVSNEQFLQCTKEKRCASLKKQSSNALPVTGVNWLQAKQYCQWVSGNLPTEAQWEKASQMESKFLPLPNTQRLLSPDEVPSSVSLYGVRNALGNAMEWVMDCFHYSFYRFATEKDPFFDKKNCVSRVIRGGSFQSSFWEKTSFQRNSALPLEKSISIGFRCVVIPVKTK